MINIKKLFKTERGTGKTKVPVKRKSGTHLEYRRTGRKEKVNNPKFKTSTGTIETIKTERGILIRFFNDSTKREVGITIPKKVITSFLRRHVYIGSNESIEVIMENGGVTIIGTTNFGRNIPTPTTVSRSTWAKIETEIKKNL